MAARDRRRTGRRHRENHRVAGHRGRRALAHRGGDRRRHRRGRRHTGDHDRRHPCRRRESCRTATDYRRRAGDFGDHWHEYLTVGRQGVRAQADRADGQNAAGHRAGRQRVGSGGRHRPTRRLGGAGARRAGAGCARRADAPRGLRIDRGQAAGGDQDHRRQAARAVRGDDDRRPRGIRRRGDPIDGVAQGPDGGDGQSHNRLGANGFRGTQPGADRVAHRFSHRDPRNRCRERGFRRLPAVGWGDPGAAHRLAGVRPVRHDHPVRAHCAGRPRPILRRARAGHL